MPCFDFSPLVFNLRILPVLDPPICFFTVFCTVNFIACFGDFFFVTTSTSTGAACTINSRPSFLTTGQRDFLAIGNAALPIPAAKAPKPLSCWG